MSLVKLIDTSKYIVMAFYTIDRVVPAVIQLQFLNGWEPVMYFFRQVIFLLIMYLGFQYSIVLLQFIQKTASD